MTASADTTTAAGASHYDTIPRSAAPTGRDSFNNATASADVHTTVATGNANVPSPTSNPADTRAKATHTTPRNAIAAATTSCRFY